GAALIVRLNPLSVVLCDATGQSLSLRTALQRQKIDTIRTLAVVIQSSDGQDEVRGWVHAYRLNAEQAGRARHKCRQRHKKGTPKVKIPAASCGAFRNVHQTNSVAHFEGFSGTGYTDE